MTNVPGRSVPSFCVNVSVVEGRRVNNLTCEIWDVNTLYTSTVSVGHIHPTTKRIVRGHIYTPKKTYPFFPVLSWWIHSLLLGCRVWHGCWKHCWGPGTIGHMSALYCTALYCTVHCWVSKVTVAPVAVACKYPAQSPPGAPTARVSHCPLSYKVRLSHNKVQKEDFLSVLICL